jgi:hypothetical protein
VSQSGFKRRCLEFVGKGWKISCWWVSNDDVAFHAWHRITFAAQPSTTLPNQISSHTVLHQLNTPGKMGHIALKTVEASMDVAPGHGGRGHDHRMLILQVQAAQHELPVLLDLSRKFLELSRPVLPIVMLIAESAESDPFVSLVMEPPIVNVKSLWNRLELRKSKIPHQKFSYFSTSRLKLTRLVSLHSPRFCYSNDTEINTLRYVARLREPKLILCGSAQMTKLSAFFPNFTQILI